MSTLTVIVFSEVHRQLSYDVSFYGYAVSVLYTSHIKRTTDKHNSQCNNPEPEISVLGCGATPLGDMCPMFQECVVVSSVTIRRQSMPLPSDFNLVDHPRVLCHYCNKY